MSLEMNQKRSETLIKKVDTNVDLLISRLQNIVALSASTSTQEIQASEMLQIESNSTLIIRLVEELLSVTRTLKENWILNQMPKTETEADLTAGIQDKVNNVLDIIIGTKKYDEETDDIDSESEVEEEIPEIKPEPVVEIKKEEAEQARDTATVTKMITTGAGTTVDSEVKKEEKDEKPVIKDELKEEEPIQSELNLDDFPTGNLDEIDFGTFGNLESGDDDIIMLD